jgi:hypothetical protein
VCTYGLCWGDAKIPLRADATLECKIAPGCDPKRRRKMYDAWPRPLGGCWEPAVHANCCHNEIAALLLRSLGKTPPAPDERARAPVLREFRLLRRMVCSRYSGERWTYLQAAQSYKGAMGRRYLEAEESLREDGNLSARDVLLRAFVKAEKFDNTNKFQKPRMIFPRSPRYNLVLASRLKPFEHWLWRNLQFEGHSRFRSRVVAKGLDQRGRAELIRDKFLSTPDCVVFEVDGKAFEAHVDFWQLLCEHSVYEAAFPGDGELKRTLNKQLRNFGVSAGGVKFSRVGGRASGDYNTGMGNSLLMLCIVRSVLRAIGVRFDVLVDGDNALVFLRRVDCPRVCSSFAPLALELSGHEMVLEKPVGVLEEIRFGQSAPVCTPFGWTMVRDWRKVLSHGAASHAHLQEPKFSGVYLRGVALCEAALSRGLPVLSVWAHRLLASTEDVGRIALNTLSDYQHLGVRLDRLEQSPLFSEPTMACRESFSRAFGVSPDEQVALEASLGSRPALSGAWSPREFFGGLGECAPVLWYP